MPLSFVKVKQSDFPQNHQILLSSAVKWKTLGSIITTLNIILVLKKLCYMELCVIKRVLSFVILYKAGCENCTAFLM